VKRCECCGHFIPETLTLCVCGHPMNSHNDNGGRNKKAYCTVWTNHPDDPRKPSRQCDCPDAQEASTT
jgi:hypothetical protein